MGFMNNGANQKISIVKHVYMKNDNVQNDSFTEWIQPENPQANSPLQPRVFFLIN